MKTIKNIALTIVLALGSIFVATLTIVVCDSYAGGWKAGRITGTWTGDYHAYNDSAFPKPLPSELTLTQDDGGSVVTGTFTVFSPIRTQSIVYDVRGTYTADDSLLSLRFTSPEGIDETLDGHILHSAGMHIRKNDFLALSIDGNVIPAGMIDMDAQ